MSRFLLGMFVPILIVALLVFALWVFDALNLVDVNKEILTLVGKIPGYENLEENYEIGKQRSKVLKEKEMELVDREDKINKKDAELKKKEEELALLEQALEDERLKREAQKIPVVASGNKGEQVLTAYEEEVQHYIEIVSGMKAENAAAFMQKLSYDLTWDILQRVQTSQAKKIMDKLPTPYVTTLTQRKVTVKKK